MSDSVDRVFAQALHTVRRIPRTGSTRPPPTDRLRLYGLYKQSTEGDVPALAERPGVGNGGNTNETEGDVERLKWDAWNQQRGLSKTEAKRRYIELLIGTMRRYAGGSEDAKELVSELEYVWDSIKSNQTSLSPSLSSPSAPVQTHHTGDNNDEHHPQEQHEQRPMRVLPPNSQDDEDEHDRHRKEVVDDEDEEDDHFDDAQEGILPDDGLHSGHAGAVAQHQPRSSSQWRSHVEQALVKLTAETAALREQLQVERRRISDVRVRSWWRGRSMADIWAWILRVLWRGFKHLLIDLVVLLAMYAWRWRRRRRRGPMGGEGGGGAGGSEWWVDSMVDGMLGWVGERIGTGRRLE